MNIARVTFAVLAITALAIDAKPAAAEIYRPWCVQYGGSDGDNGTTCAFTSFDQCMMTARGGGGFCVQNPWYLAYGSGQKGPQNSSRPTEPSGADRGSQCRRLGPIGHLSPGVSHSRPGSHAVST